MEAPPSLRSINYEQFLFFTSSSALQSRTALLVLGVSGESVFRNTLCVFQLNDRIVVNDSIRQQYMLIY